MNHVDVVIVGAGLSGLSAARRLTQAGKTVAVLEARDRVAGRNHGATFSNGVPIEMGGQWVGPTQDAVLALIDELGLKTYPSYDSGESITYYDGTVHRYADESFGLSDTDALEVGRIWESITVLADSVDLATPWTTTGAEDLDRQTFDQWLVGETSNDVVIRFFRLVVPALFSAESHELSLLHFLFYMKSGTSLEVLISTTGGAQESRVIGGTHQLSERMAADLGDVVRLNTAVTGITQTDRGVVVTFDGGEISAAHAVVAIPQTLAGRLRYSPPLPATRDALTQQFPAGSVIKVNVAYPTPFWREEGLNGFVMSLDDAFNVVLDNSPHDDSCGVLVGFLEGRHARAAAELAAEERRDLILGALVKYFGEKAAEPLEILELNWNAEEFTRGCYGGRLAAGVWTNYGKAVAAPVGRIHWAGAETSDVWNGYMDGAIRSGYRAAAAILDSDN
ncbi:flavin monoamine oxidase family protein [Gordonia sp. NPDC003424]